MSESETVKADLRELEHRNIDYCLLRNWEFLHGDPLDDDVDVLIPRDQQSPAIDALHSLGYYKKSGGTTRHSFFKKYVKGSKSIISLDIAWDGPGYNGLPLVDVDRMLDGRRREAGVWVPCDEDRFVELLFHAIVNKNGFAYKEAYRQQLLDMRFTVNQDRILSHSQYLFGDTGYKVARLALSGELAAIESYKWDLVFANVRKRPMMAPTLFQNLIVHHQITDPIRKLNARFNPFARQPTVVILGPDGSGKTTTAKNLKTLLEANDITVAYARLGVYNESSPIMDVLKRVRNTIARTDTTQRKQARDEGTMELGPTNTPLKAAIHALDILVRTARSQASGAEVIVADRYIHDIFIFDDPGPVRRLIEFMDRGALYVYVLDAETAIIADRSEYSSDSIGQMREILQQIDGEQLDVSDSPEQTLQVLIEHLCTETDFLSRLP